MTRFLMVPVQVDLLRLEKPTRVVEAMADFSRLPYFDGEGDANADTAYLSENLVSQPLENRNLTLPPGVHLHWALPQALTRGRQTKAGTDFPAVPNRWLVRRHGPDGSKYWLVESDYLYPADTEGMDTGIEAGAICYPLRHPTSGEPPFRYLGRALAEEAWAQAGRGDYLPERLTAVGYGQPLFAAFYPNCRSVFGFYDDDPPPAGSNTFYAVYGWYGDPGDDPAAGLKPAALAEQYGWQLAEDAETPQRLLCSGVRHLAQALAAGEQPEPATAEVVVGNTATEALSAYLAHREFPDNDLARRELEDRLEALHLAPLLDHREVDTGPKFREARHEKGFAPAPGGHIWQVRARPAGGGREGHRHGEAGVTLPPAVAGTLNELNRRQQHLDTLAFRLQSWRERLFDDWYRYQLSAYPPIGEAGDYPDPDHVRHFIEEHDLKPLQALQAEVEDAEKQAGEVRARLAQQLAELQLVIPADLQSLDALAREVQARQEALFQPLQKLLPSPGSNGHPPGRARVAQAFNALLQQSDLRQRLSFPGKPPAEAQQLAQIAILSPADLLRYNRLLLQSLFPSLGRRARYEVQQVPGPRFWQPQEPVVLLAGPHVEPSSRYQPGKVACGLLELEGDLPQALVDDGEAVPGAPSRKQVRRRLLQTLNAPAQLLASTVLLEAEQQAALPWHPVFLEWQVRYYPLGRRDRPLTATGYDPDFLQAHYRLRENGIELVAKENPVPIAENYYAYSGRSILTPQALPLLRQWIDDYLRQRLLPAYYAAQQTPDGQRSAAFFDRKRTEILGWYHNTLEQQDAFTGEVLRVERLLDDSNLQIQTQVLSGFNAALLGHKQTMQLPVDSPLAFAAYEPFVEQVREAVGRHSRVAPQAANGFHPLRAGAMEVAQLRLVNSFGLVRELDVGDVRAVDVMHDDTKGEERRVWLPPRLVQPARLDWRWLAATDSKEELNKRPADSPICGWLVPNNLDSSLMVYDGDGKALGILSRKDRWQPAPGAASAVAGPEAIANPHLRQVVAWLAEKGDDLLQEFISALDGALENIDPDAFAQHEAQALLMGRPLAVVRATLGLEQRGLPALNQDWNLFRQSLRTGRPDTAGVGRLQVSVRLGEHRQLNDGLAGYWLEGDGGALSAHFYSPQADSLYTAAAGTTPTRIIVTYDKGEKADSVYKVQSGDTLWALSRRFDVSVEAIARANDIDDANLIRTGMELLIPAADPRLPPLALSIDGRPQALTLLVDPRGSVHATSGLLPTAVLSIPPEQFAPALEALELNFRALPVLAALPPGQDRPAIRLPLPPEPGYAWSWVEAEADGSWLEAAEIEPAQQGLYQGEQTAREGWLRLQPVTKRGDSRPQEEVEDGQN